VERFSNRGDGKAGKGGSSIETGPVGKEKGPGFCEAQTGPRLERKRNSLIYLVRGSIFPCRLRRPAFWDRGEREGELLEPECLEGKRTVLSDREQEKNQQSDQGRIVEREKERRKEGEYTLL